MVFVLLAGATAVYGSFNLALFCMCIAYIVAY